MTGIDKILVEIALATEDPARKEWRLNYLRRLFEAQRENEERAAERRAWLESLPAEERARVEAERREQHKRIEQSFFNDFPEFAHEAAVPSSK